MRSFWIRIFATFWVIEILTIAAVVTLRGSFEDFTLRPMSEKALRAMAFSAEEAYQAGQCNELNPLFDRFDVALRRRAISDLMLSNCREVVPAMPHCMVLDNELCRHRRAKSQRERGRVVEFLIRESSNCRGSPAAVLPQEFERGRLRDLSTVLSMLRIQLRHDLPRDIRNGFATGDGSGDINLDWIHAGNMVNDNSDRAVVGGRDRCPPFRI